MYAPSQWSCYNISSTPIRLGAYTKLSLPIISYFQLDPKEHTTVKFKSNYTTFLWRKWIRNYCLWIDINSIHTSFFNSNKFYLTTKHKAFWTHWTQLVYFSIYIRTWSETHLRWKSLVLKGHHQSLDNTLKRRQNDNRTDNLHCFLLIIIKNLFIPYNHNFNWFIKSFHHNPFIDKTHWFIN